MLLVIACAGLGVVAWVCLRPVTLPHVKPDQASSTKAPVEYETWKATEAAAFPSLQSYEGLSKHNPCHT